MQTKCCAEADHRGSCIWNQREACHTPFAKMFYMWGGRAFEWVLFVASYGWGGGRDPQQEGLDLPEGRCKTSPLNWTIKPLNERIACCLKNESEADMFVEMTSQERESSSVEMWAEQRTILLVLSHQDPGQSCCKHVHMNVQVKVHVCLNSTPMNTLWMCHPHIWTSLKWVDNYINKIIH